MKRIFSFLFVMIFCFASFGAIAGEMDVKLERFYINLDDGQEELIPLDDWLDGLGTQLGYRPKWTMIDITGRKAIVDLINTIIEVEYEEDPEGEMMVRNTTLPELVVSENELFTKYPDNQRFSVSSLETIDNDQLQLVYFHNLKEEYLYILLVSPKNYNLYESLKIRDYKFENGAYTISADAYRQLFYWLTV